MLERWRLTGVHTHATTLDPARLRRERIRIVYSHGYHLVGGVAFVTLLATAATWPVGGHLLPLMVLWLAATAALLLVRLLYIYRYRRLDALGQPLRHRLWGLSFCALSALNGVLWGTFTMLAHTGEAEIKGIVFSVHVIYIAGALISSSVYLPVFLAFALPASMLYLAVLLGASGHPPDWRFASTLFILVVLAIVFARRNSLSIAEQIRLRVENERLLADLTVERDRAEEAMLTKNRFLAAASHDLRQPVHALGLFAGSLESQIEGPGPRSVLGLMQQAIAALGALFDSLLDISKLDAGVVTSVPCDIALAPLIERLRAEHSALAQNKGLALDTDVDGTLSAFADPALLERVLLNLIGNAIKYTDTGAIRIAAHAIDDKHISIEVHDSGRGIPATEHKRVFSEYHQLENPARDSSEGLGLGLAIVKRLCALINATITLESATGTGSTFTLTLIRGVPAVIEPQTCSATDENPGELVGSEAFSTSASDLGRCRLALVVDDEWQVRDGMRRVLESWGIVTIAGGSARDTLEMLQKRDSTAVPDVLIVDLRLAGGANGLDAIATIREEFNAEIPALVITGDTGSEQLRLTQDSGIPVLHKPVTPARLCAELAQLLEVGQSCNMHMTPAH